VARRAQVQRGLNLILEESQHRKLKGNQELDRQISPNSDK